MQPANLKTPELLAPAGSSDAAFAAFEYGADAVYLGLDRFSARAEATTLTLDEVSELSDFAHRAERPRRVYVTLNTLVLEKELPALIETLVALRELRVDALIVQDLGLCQIAREHVPELELHASTQMAIHSAAGARQLDKLGIRRVIPARELTLPEVGEICALPGLEVEVFIHGALCYGYSGLCLLSSHLRGPSGNRGECAYLCRTSFGTDGAENRRAGMSMKDLAIPEKLEELQRLGVASLKIEGRKKSPLYVAAVTHYYRRLLDGTLSPGEEAELERDVKTIFSRPWTPLFTGSVRQRNVTDPDTVGHRGAPIGLVEGVVGGDPDRLRFTVRHRAIERFDGLQIEIPGREKPYGFGIEDLRIAGRSAFRAEPGTKVDVTLPPRHPRLPIGATVHCASSQLVKNAYKWSRPRPGTFGVHSALQITVSLAEKEISVSAVAGDLEIGFMRPLDEELSEARSPDGVVRAVTTAFGKLGGTAYEADSITVDNPALRFAPASLLNDIRREMVERLDRKTAIGKGQQLDRIRKAIIVEKGELQPSVSASPTWSIKVDRAGVCSEFEEQDFAGMTEAILVVDRFTRTDLDAEIAFWEERLGKDRIRLALPTVVRREHEDELLERIRELRSQGHGRWQLANLAGLSYLPGKDDLDLSADWPLYSLNHAAGEQLQTLGFSSWTLSPEDGQQNMCDLLSQSPASTSVIAFQDTPLAISATCLFASQNGSCPGRRTCQAKEMWLEARNGERLLVINDHCQSVVLSGQAFCLSGYLDELPAANFRADFIWRPRTPQEVQTIWRELRENHPIPGTHAANYQRELDGSGELSSLY